MSKAPFGKFIKKEGGAKKKEMIRQEKRQARIEKNAFFEAKKAKRPGASPAAPAKTYGAARPAAGANRATAGTGASANRPKTITPRTTPTIQGKEQASAAPRMPAKEVAGDLQLNKYIAHSGACSRRDAALLVKKGRVSVNGLIVTEPGTRVRPGDEVKFDNKVLHLQQNLVYILLNKPKDYLTTVTDPQGRKTVMDIVRQATTERIFPVGRLDRNTTGVLLLTNDGELSQKLTHPSNQVKKIYEVTLDKPLTKSAYETILKGITLEDGFIAPDALAYANPANKAVIGVEIHSGRNRIVRRIFEHMGYDVKLLDRVMFANLTKKAVERGKWRFLNEREVRNLKFLNAAAQKKKSAPPKTGKS